MTENIKFKCSCCGEIQEKWPAITFLSPYNYGGLSESDKNNIAYLDSDFCVINSGEKTERYIRCVLTQKVNGHCVNLDYGVWASLSEKDYLDYKENRQTESEEKIYYGWLCNDIPDYEFKQWTPIKVVTKEIGLRPEAVPDKNFEHPFVMDYYDGISKKEAERRISEMLKAYADRSSGKDETEIKKWWQVWK